LSETGQALSLFNELKRRNVFRVGVAYVVVAWLIMQVADVVLNNIEMPGWAFHLILLLLAVGFPLTLILAWAFELTPEGIKKESEVSRPESVTRQTGQKLNYVIIAALAITVIYLVLFKDRVDVGTDDSLQALIARPSVIVLPFTNTSADNSKDYLSFGITDELITGLQRYQDFPVISRNASLEFSDSNLSANDYATSLGADYRVEGSISAGDDGIRVLATLSSAGDQQVWAERFQGIAGNAELFDVADELLAKIAAAVLKSEIHRVQRTDRPTADAWEHYIKGLDAVLTFNLDRYESARQHLDQAVEIAPDMAEAWWAIGELEVNKYASQPMVEENDLEQLHTIIGYFRKSHELSPFYAAACGCLGFILTSVGQADEARAIFKQAIEANPLSARLRVDYALFLLWDNRYEEAMENGDLAMKLGAFSTSRAYVWGLRSTVALAQGNRAGALEAVNRAIFISKDPFSMSTAVALLYALGKQADAARLMDEMQQSFPGISPQNPLLYVTLKPIDDILARQRELGDKNAPADVNEIYRLLSKTEP
jgi:TolB-like protein/Tfp pilus assembly protein PilF